jgi:hypothetical protein
MATVKQRLRRGLVLFGATCVLTLFVASACGSPTGPPNTPQPDDTTDEKTPPGPEKEGFLLLPSEDLALLV